MTRQTFKYADVKLSDRDIAQESYKSYLGGGAALWEERGAFQPLLLRKLGLQPSSSLLDIGCGPIRGGQHLIKFLDHGKYFGCDYNADFVLTAERIVQADEQLAEKSPSLAQIAAFDIRAITSRTFDFALAFSVLNHCSASERRIFFEQVGQVLNQKGQAVVTHAAWFDPSQLQGTNLRVKRRIEGEQDIAPDFKMTEWGWATHQTIFPIIAFSPAT